MYNGLVLPPSENEKDKSSRAGNEPKDEKSGFVVPFWAVPSSASKKSANMKVSFMEEVVGTGSSRMVFNIPVMVNTQPLKAGDFLQCERWEPPRKCARLVAP